MKKNLLVAQSGGPTAVINASLSGVIKEALEREEIGEVYGAKYGVEGVFREDFINLRDTVLEQKRSIFPVESMDITNLSPLAEEICQEERDAEMTPDRMQSLAFFFLDSPQLRPRLLGLAGENYRIPRKIPEILIQYFIFLKNGI